MIISGSAGTQFSSMIYEFDVVFGHRRYQRQPRNWFPVMISGFGGTQFSSMISDSDVVYGRRRFSVSHGTGYGDDFWVWSVSVFVNDFSF